jgi:hypothetical protein
MDGCLIRILLFLSPALAQADLANNEWYSTTRALSMGNVGLASAEDSATAMFYNPAALARTKKVTAELFSPQIDVGTGVFTLGRGAADLSKHGSLRKVRPLVEARSNRASYLGGSLYPSISAQNFNFGVLLRGEGLSFYDGKQLVYRSRHVLIPTLGISIGSLAGRFRLGLAARVIQITENDRTLTGTIASNGPTGYQPGYLLDAQEGLGIGLDAGALLSLPVAGLPTLGVVARNVGDTSFTGSAPVGFATGSPTRKQKMKMTYDLGFSVSPKFGRKNSFTLGADYRDALNQNQVSTLRRINLGLEFSFSRILYLRTGLSRGYFTAGFGLASKYGSLDLGTYAEELDARGFRKKEDRRISIKFGSRF